MADAGELGEYVDSGQVSLTNVTDNLVFKQMFDTRVNIWADITKHQLTSDNIDKLFDLRDFTIEADIWLTEPELVTFVAYTDQTDHLPVAKSWKVTYTGDDGAATTLTGTFRLSRLKPISPEEGYVNYHIVLESVDGVVADA